MNILTTVKFRYFEIHYFKLLVVMSRDGRVLGHRQCKHIERKLCLIKPIEVAGTRI